MPRPTKGARLHLRNAKRPGGVRRWVILARSATGKRIEVSTGCFESDRAGAEERLVEHLAKHPPKHRAAKRLIDITETTPDGEPIRFVQEVTDRNGYRRFYFRRPGHVKVSLPPLWSPDFTAVYAAALAGKAYPASTLPGGVRAKRGVDPNTVQPLVGVYLLMLRGRVAYIGESVNMPNRVAAHRTNGRPFDQVFYIATKANQRKPLERALINALHPTQNKVHRATKTDASLIDTPESLRKLI